MKKIILVLSMLIALAGLSVAVCAEEEQDGIAYADITDDSVLIFKDGGEDVAFEVKVSTSLGYQEVVLPYGTDLSELHFYPYYDKMNFSFTDEIKQAYDIKDEWINGYNIALRDLLDSPAACINASVDGNEYVYWGEFSGRLNEGSTYTVSIESSACSLPEKENWTEGSHRRLTIRQGCKFAFKIRIAGENEKIGPDAEVTEGREFTLTEGDATDLVIRVDKDFDKFEGVMCNEVMLEKDVDYTAEEGSTVITLSKDYVKTLKAGEYTIKAVFKDCYSEAVALTVVSVVEPPATGDAYNVILLSVLSVAVLAVTILINKKHKVTE